MQTPRQPSHASFYVPGSYGAHKNVGYLTKRVLASIVQQAEARLVPYGVTHAHWPPLFKLSEEGKPVAVAEFARVLQMDSGAITRLHNQIERKGLGKRVRSIQDLCLVKVGHTSEGELAGARVPTVLSEVLNAHLAGYSNTEWQPLTAYPRRTLANDRTYFVNMTAYADTGKAKTVEANK